MDNFSRTSFDTKQLKNLQILTITTNLTIEKINRKQRTANSGHEKLLVLSSFYSIFTNKLLS